MDYLVLLRMILTIILVTAALIKDIRTFKIKNKLVFSFMIIGGLLSFVFYGIDGLKSSLVGISVPIASLFILFALRMLGAGDIKLFSAIGALMGWKFIIHTMAYSFLAGGIISIGVIISRKNGLKRIKHLFNYLKACLLSLSLLSYSDFESHSEGDKFSFAYSIFAGTLSAFLIPCIFNFELF